MNNVDEIKKKAVFIDDEDEPIILRKYENRKGVDIKPMPKGENKIQKRKIDFEESISIGD